RGHGGAHADRVARADRDAASPVGRRLWVRLSPRAVRARRTRSPPAARSENRAALARERAPRGVHRLLARVSARAVRSAVARSRRAAPPEERTVRVLGNAYLLGIAAAAFALMLFPWH